MGRRYTGGWEGPKHYVDWMKFVFDEDYDAGDMEIDRLAVAWETMDNRKTCVSVILNQWSRAEQPEAWDACEAHYDAHAWDNRFKFEEDTIAFLESIGHLVLRDKMQGAAHTRDFLAELGNGTPRT